MDYEIVFLDEMKVAGPIIRTTNENGKSMIDQPGFWSSYFENNITAMINNKINPAEIMGVYLDYENDYTKPFSFMIAYKVEKFIGIQEGIVTKIIPSGKYARFVGKGKDNMEKVANTWRRIWESDIERRYNVDFELYNLNDPDSDVVIYIGIK